MEDLFWTELSINGNPEAYHIVFENEDYRFIPKKENLQTFTFRREHDEWHAADDSSEAVRDEALQKLEAYLLRQH